MDGSRRPHWLYVRTSDLHHLTTHTLYVSTTNTPIPIQDAEIGDGTTSVVLLAGEMLKQLKSFVEEGVHPQIIMRNIRSAGKLAVQKVQELLKLLTPEGMKPARQISS